MQSHGNDGGERLEAGGWRLGGGNLKRPIIFSVQALIVLGTRKRFEARHFDQRLQSSCGAAARAKPRASLRALGRQSRTASEPRSGD